jgi:two-component system cell cycle response regulator DivK
VVEDTWHNRKMLRDLLTRAGFEVLEAVNGEEGIAQAERHRPDLILMDIQLPLVDGYDATRRIKANPDLHHIPIIAVTSYALILSTSRSKCSRIRGSVRAPYGDSSSTSRARLNSDLAVPRLPSCSSRWPASKWRVDVAIRSRTGSGAGVAGGAVGAAAAVATGCCVAGRATVFGACAAQAAEDNARAHIAPRSDCIGAYSTIPVFSGSTISRTGSAVAAIVCRLSRPAGLHEHLVRLA